VLGGVVLLGGQDPSEGGVVVGLGGRDPSRVVDGVGEKLVKGDLVVRAAGKSRAHKVRDERGRLLEEAAERAGLEGLGKKGEKIGVQSAEGGGGRSSGTVPRLFLF
jgi:hypothetical protein